MIYLIKLIYYVPLGLANVLCDVKIAPDDQTPGQNQGRKLLSNGLDNPDNSPRPVIYIVTSVYIESTPEKPNAEVGGSQA